LTKRFGRVLACDEVDLTVDRGVIQGLLGQNGAGKTTLMRMLSGLIQPDSGRIVIDGQEQQISNPLVAAGLGVAMVHQHFSLIGALSVWENMILGEKGRVDRGASIERVREISGRYGLAVDPLALVENLSTGERQRVEIIKCLRRNPSIIILDEPTAVLTPNESKTLFSVLRRVVVDEAKAVVLISHKLDEIIEATDEITIMRDGRVVRRLPTPEATARILAREMLGREISLKREAASLGLLDLAAQEATAELDDARASGTAPGSGVSAVHPTAGRPQDTAPPDVDEPVLRITDATVRSADGRTLLDGLSLKVAAGEVLGIAGIEGNGQNALGDLLSGVVPLEQGSVEVGGRRLDVTKTGATLRAGIAVIPEDRHAAGCVLGMTVAENLVLDNLARVAPRRILNARRMNAYAQTLIEEYGIVCPAPDIPMRTLSGGNQQKVIVARALSRAPRLLVAVQATRGLDVGAIDDINRRLKAAAEDGVAVLLISAELEEVLSLSDRLAVMHRGRIVGEMPRGRIDRERLGLMMGGQAA
jgi:simple sugar transport system ATP-binding protein